MQRQRKQLRELLADGPFVAVECLSASTARVVEQAGVPVAYVGGSGLGNYLLGIPDHGLISTTEMISFAADIAAAIDIPLIVDGDQGGETALNTYRTVQGLERAGVAGVHLEDTVNPKHMYEGDSLVPVDEMQLRIEAALAARRDEDFVVIARTDALFNGGTVDEAIERGIAYADAGADAYMPIQLPHDDIARVREAIPIPLVDINVPRDVQERTGLALNIHTGPALAHALRAHRAWVQEIIDTGRTDFSAVLGEYEALKLTVREEEVWLPLAREWAARHQRSRI